MKSFFANKPHNLRKLKEYNSGLTRSVYRLVVQLFEVLDILAPMPFAWINRDLG